MYKNVLLKFGASWCAPCKSASKFLKSNFDESKYIEIDITSNEKLAEEYSVRNLPTFVLINANGDEIQRFTGFEPNAIKEAIQKIY